MEYIWSKLGMLCHRFERKLIVRDTMRQQWFKSYGVGTSWKNYNSVHLWFKPLNNCFSGKKFDYPLKIVTWTKKKCKIHGEMTPGFEDYPQIEVSTIPKDTLQQSIKKVEESKKYNVNYRHCHYIYTDGHYCERVCEFSEKLGTDPPPILKVDILAGRTNRIWDWNDLKEISFNNRKYKFVSLVMGNGQHFVLNFVIFDNKGH